MFRHLNIAMRCFGDTGYLRILRLLDRLTPIALRIEYLYVPPRKGGTFCFPGLVADAIAPLRIAAGS
jgi:hypothetical protein